MGIEKGRGELWKDGARFLQHRLRDRFRVAVDRHRRRSRKVSDGYLSSMTQRWLHRFRDFRRESLPSSSTFYRKTGLCMDVWVFVHLWVCMYHIVVGSKEVLEIRISLYCFIENVANGSGDFVCWTVIPVHNYGNCSMLCNCFIWDLLRLTSFALWASSFLLFLLYLFIACSICW